MSSAAGRKSHILTLLKRSKRPEIFSHKACYFKPLEGYMYVPKEHITRRYAT
jgi:hypothetical protein